MKNKIIHSQKQKTFTLYLSRSAQRMPSHVRLVPQVGNPFVFSTFVTDADSDKDKGNGKGKGKGEGKDKGKGIRDLDFWMYYSAGSTHLDDSNIDEPLHLGLGQ